MRLVQRGVYYGWGCLGVYDCVEKIKEENKFAVYNGGSEREGYSGKTKVLTNLVNNAVKGKVFIVSRELA